MADKPYTERTGGSYVRDKDTGKLIRAEDVKPASPPPEEKPSPATERKGK